MKTGGSEVSVLVEENISVRSCEVRPDNEGSTEEMCMWQSFSFFLFLYIFIMKVTYWKLSITRVIYSPNKTVSLNGYDDVDLSVKFDI